MKVKVGDRVEYWGGLEGSILAEGIVARIELAPEVMVELEDPAAEALVEDLDLDQDSGGTFIDIEGGKWTYSARLISVNGVTVADR